MARTPEHDRICRFCAYWQNVPSCSKTKATDGCRQWKRDHDPVTDFIEKILKSDFDPNVFTTVDDRDMPEAPNWLTWCIGKEFLNKRLWAKQIEMGLALFGDACQDCSDPAWVKDIDKTASVEEIMDHIQLMEFGVCPKCKKSNLDFEKEGKFFHPYQLTACLGQRCVTGETQIFTENGLTDFDELQAKLKAPLGLSDYNIGVMGKRSLVQATKFFVGEPSTIKKLNIKSGITLGATLDHPIRVVGLDGTEQWRLTKDVNVGDVVPIYYGQNVWPERKKLPKQPKKMSACPFCQKVVKPRGFSAHLKSHKNIPSFERVRKQYGYFDYTGKYPEYMTKDLAFFLGVWVAEGTASRCRITISNKDVELLEKLATIIKENFDYAPIVDDVGLTIKNKSVIGFLYSLGVKSGNSQTVQVPRSIKNSCREDVCAFLQGYFEGDGGINKNIISAYIEASTISYKLHLQIRALLLNLGIFCYSQVGTTWATNGSPKQVEKENYTVIIKSGRARTAFKEDIGFFSKRKQESLNLTLTQRTNNVPFDDEKIPNSLKSFLYAEINRIDNCIREQRLPYKDKRGHTKFYTFGSLLLAACPELIEAYKGKSEHDIYKKLIRPFYTYNICVRKQQLFTLLTALKKFALPVCEPLIKKLVYLTKENIVFDTVIDVTEDNAVTYDLHVPELHRFWTNGIISHNTGKSTISAGFIATYMLHKFLKLPDPSRFFELHPTELHMTFTAVDYTQAEDTLWTPFKSFVEDSPWFIEYNRLLQYYERKTSQEILFWKDTFFLYRHKRLTGYAMSPNKRKMRGRTRFLYCLSGNSLINTKDGLLTLKQNLIGNNICLGNKQAEIIDWQMTGTKSCKRVTLKKGYNVVGTGDHKILTLSSDLKPTWKKIDDLQIDDYVAISRGGIFPEKLEIHYESIANEPLRINQLFEYVHTHDVITTADLVTFLDKGKVHKNMRRLQRLGMLTKTRKGRHGLASYTKTDKFNIDLLLHKDVQKNLTTPTEMTPELATIIGYLVSEGSYNTSIEVCFGNTNKVVTDHYVDCFQKVFGIAPNRDGYREKKENRLYYYRARFGWSKLKNFLRYLGLDESIAHTKRVPWSILQAPKACAIAFFAALFEGDGDGDGTYVKYASASLDLLRDLQILLLRLNIVCRILPPKSPVCGALLFSRTDAKIFMDTIGFVTKASNGWLLENKRPGHTVHFAIPHLKFVSRDGKEVRRVWLEPSINKIPRYQKANKLLTDDERTKVKELEKLGFLWLPVQKINSLKTPKPVYDITVNSEEHFFAANGIICHNCLDEPGHFDEEAESRKITLNCDEVNAALDRSMTTIREAADRKRRQGFTNVPDGIGCLVSSPSSINDKIMRELRVSEGDNKKVAFHLATWEAHPAINRDSPTMVSAFHDNASKANRDFGAIPGFGENTFIGDDAQLKNCISTHNMLASVSYQYHANEIGERTKYAKVSFRGTDKFTPYMVAVDAGYSFNSFAVVVMHMHGSDMVVDLLVEVAPEKDCRIDFKRMWEHTLLPICDNLNVLCVAYDRWQSIQQMQELKDRKQFAENYSVTRSDFINFRSHISAGTLKLPKIEMPFESIHKIKESVETLVIGKPVVHFILQALTVREVGHKIDKGINMTDDLFRSAVLAASYLEDPEWKSKFASLGSGMRSGNKVGGVIRSRGGGAGGMQGGSLGQSATSSGVIKPRSGGRA